MDEELRRTVEAVLFAAARKLELEEISKLCKSQEKDVLALELHTSQSGCPPHLPLLYQYARARP